MAAAWKRARPLAVVSACCTGLVFAHVAPLSSITLRQISTGERVLVDEAGRQRIFHGANVVVKGPPWMPSRGGFDYQTSLVKEDFVLMQQAGMNAIRLGLMWAGAEPKRGEYNETYFAEMRALIAEAASYGIYTFVDMHQDVLSERFCGEGIPRWATDVHTGPIPDPFDWFPEPVLSRFTKMAPDGNPTRQDCKRLIDAVGNFQAGYWTDSAEQAFQNLYVNANDLTNAWGLFFAKFLSGMKGDPSLLGVNLINEPFTGNAYHNPFRLLPWLANKELQKAYDIVVQRIREVDENRLVLFPAIVWSDLHLHERDNGFDHPPGGDEYANRSLLSFHYYTPPQARGSAKSFVENVQIPNAQRLQTGIFLTETWGSDWEEIAPFAEQHGISWNYWEWKDFCKETPETLNSSLQAAAFGACKTGYGGGLFNESGMRPEKHRKLGRMYAYAIQGVLTNHTFNATKSRLDFQFQLEPSIAAPTEVFANPQWHAGAGGFNVEVSPAGALEHEVVADQFLIRLSAAKNAIAGLVNVTITPAAEHELLAPPVVI